MDMRERVIKTIKFEQPDRVPIYIWYDSKTLIKYGKAIGQLMKRHPNHILEVPYTDSKGWKGGKGEDEWGVVWTEDVKQGIRVMEHPLKQWDRLEDYDFPDAEAESRFNSTETVLKENKENKFAMGCLLFALFERLWMLRGFENVLVDLMREDRRLFKLSDRIMDFNLKVIKRMLELGVDGIFFTDDYGTQERLMMHPNVWRAFFKPQWKRIFDEIHRGRAFAVLHSCGNVESIIPDLIDAGLDVLNPVQPHAMNIDELGEKYQGRLCFFGGVDVQGTLPLGTEEDVEREVKHLIWTLGNEKGGYIGCTSHTILCDVPLQNIKAMYKAFERWGTLSR